MSRRPPDPLSGGRLGQPRSAARGGGEPAERGRPDEGGATLGLPITRENKATGRQLAARRPLCLARTPTQAAAPGPTPTPTPMQTSPRRSSGRPLAGQRRGEDWTASRRQHAHAGRKCLSKQRLAPRPAALAADLSLCFARMRSAGRRFQEPLSPFTERRATGSSGKRLASWSRAKSRERNHFARSSADKAA